MTLMVRSISSGKEKEKKNYLSNCCDEEITIRVVSRCIGKKKN